MIAGMPKSLWPIADASAIAVRLIGLLPARPSSGGSPITGGARVDGLKRVGGLRRIGDIGQIGGIGQTARRWMTGNVLLVSACLALVVAFAITMIKQ
jgi:hypothetical protein